MDDDVERDESIERVVIRLRTMPVVDPEAKARVLIAVAAERERSSARGRESRDARTARTWVAAGALAATLVAAVVLVGRGRADSTSDLPQDVPLQPAPPLVIASAIGSATLAVDANRSRSGVRLVQFVFRSPSAKRVSVVGTFTDWKSDMLVMKRDSGSGFWSATVALPPGRHVYAFLMDDSVWVRDPRALAAPDADFGQPGSILLVPQP